MPKKAKYAFMGLPMWAGGILIVSFLLLFDMPKKPEIALLCTFGAVAAFLKIMSCGFLLGALRQYNTKECKIWLIINIILTVIVEVLILPVYFLNSSIRTPFEISAIIITAAYSVGLLVIIFLLPAPSEESSMSLVEASETP